MATIIQHTTRAPGTILTASIYNQDHSVHIANAQALNEDVNTVHRLALGVIIQSGNGLAIPTGIKGDIPVPFDCEIVAAHFVADQSTTSAIDVWVDDLANFPPLVADSITASARISSTATLTGVSTLTGWDLKIPSGSIIRWNLDSNNNARRITAWLEVLKTII